MPPPLFRLSVVLSGLAIGRWAAPSTSRPPVAYQQAAPTYRGVSAAGLDALPCDFGQRTSHIAR